MLKEHENIDHSEYHEHGPGLCDCFEADSFADDLLSEFGVTEETNYNLATIDASEIKDNTNDIHKSIEGHEHHEHGPGLCDCFEADSFADDLLSEFGVTEEKQPEIAPINNENTYTEDKISINQDIALEALDKHRDTEIINNIEENLQEENDLYKEIGRPEVLETNQKIKAIENSNDEVTSIETVEVVDAETKKIEEIPPQRVEEKINSSIDTRMNESANEQPGDNESFENTYINQNPEIDEVAKSKVDQSAESDPPIKSPIITEITPETSTYEALTVDDFEDEIFEQPVMDSFLSNTTSEAAEADNFIEQSNDIEHYLSSNLDMPNKDTENSTKIELQVERIDLFVDKLLNILQEKNPISIIDLDIIDISDPQTSKKVFEQIKNIIESKNISISVDKLMDIVTIFDAFNHIDVTKIPEFRNALSSGDIQKLLELIQAYIDLQIQYNQKEFISNNIATNSTSAKLNTNILRLISLLRKLRLQNLKSLTMN